MMISDYIALTDPLFTTWRIEPLSGQRIGSSGDIGVGAAANGVPILVSVQARRVSVCKPGCKSRGVCKLEESQGCMLRTFRL